MKLRLKILKIAISVIRLRRLRLMVILRALDPVVNLVCWVSKIRTHRKFEILISDFDNCLERSTSIQNQLRTIGSLNQEQKQNLLAAAAAMLKESEYLQGRCSTFAGPRPLGANTLTYVLGHLKYSSTNLGRKNESLERIILNAESDTFFRDVLLWLIVPSAQSEELIGDLTEEYHLRISTEGEADARAWHREQVIKSVGDYLWKHLEHLAALKFLIDCIRWGFRS
ncbi:MAG: hypothetical protein JWN92_2780 [Candidatus Acidoferrum typicum]|nr:hypothetical protein [Candidatus Acidoferrum typicum]